MEKKGHKEPVDVFIFYPGLFIIPITKLRKRRLRYFITNGLLLGAILSIIYQLYYVVSNWAWTPPEPQFVAYIKYLFVLLFFALLYILPLYFYRKHISLITKKEFIVFWEVAWLLFCIYTVAKVFLFYPSETISELLVRSKESPHWFIWAIWGKLFLQDVLWAFFIGNVVSVVILGTLIFALKKMGKWQVKGME